MKIRIPYLDYRTDVSINSCVFTIDNNDSYYMLRRGQVVIAIQKEVVEYNKSVRILYTFDGRVTDEYKSLSVIKSTRIYYILRDWVRANMK